MNMVYKAKIQVLRDEGDEDYTVIYTVTTENELSYIFEKYTSIKKSFTAQAKVPQIIRLFIFDGLTFKNEETWFKIKEETL